MQLAGPHRLRLGVGAQAGIDQLAVEPAGLIGGLQRHGELRGTGRAEIIGHAADGQDQRVIGNQPRRRHLTAFVVEGGTDADLLRRPVQPGQLAVTIGEMVPMRLSHVVQLMLGPVQAARGHRMQQRLPNMGARALNQRHIGRARPAQRVTQPGDQLQPGCTAADDNDPVADLLTAG